MFFGKRRKRRHRHCHKQRGIGLAGKCLSDLRPGQRGKILRVGGRGRARRRFMEMGLVRGETVLVERFAPLGDPIEFFVKGYHVSLRRDDARHIEVQILREEPGGGA
jgi:Fe2+ transport system protein FeoA